MDALKPASEQIGLRKEHRETYKWIDELLAPIRETAIGKRRRKERTQGKQLSEERAVDLSDELERIQRLLNTLLERREEIVGELLAHWGYTGIEKIQGTLGETLISTSFYLAVDQETIWSGTSKEEWARWTELALRVPKLLLDANTSQETRELLKTAICVTETRVSVIAPSSRRAKSGAKGKEDEET